MRAALGTNASGLRLRVPPQRIQEIAAARRAITPETALRIGRALGTGARLWLAMLQSYDVHRAGRLDADKIRAAVDAA